MTTILGQSYKQLIAVWNEPASRQGVLLEDKMTTVGAKSQERATVVGMVDFFV